MWAQGFALHNVFSAAERWAFTQPPSQAAEKWNTIPTSHWVLLCNMGLQTEGRGLRRGQATNCRRGRCCSVFHCLSGSANKHTWITGLVTVNSTADSVEAAWFQFCLGLLLCSGGGLSNRNQTEPAAQWQLTLSKEFREVTDRQRDRQREVMAAVTEFYLHAERPFRRRKRERWTRGGITWLGYKTWQSYIAHKQQDTAAITRCSVVVAAAAKKRSHIQNQLMACHTQRDTLIPAAVTITQPLFAVGQEYSCQW